jgi:hypothetical protein
MWINDYEFRIERRLVPEEGMFVEYINKGEAKRHAETLLKNDPTIECVAVWEYEDRAWRENPDVPHRGPHPVARFYQGAAPPDWPR